MEKIINEINDKFETHIGRNEIITYLKVCINLLNDGAKMGRIIYKNREELHNRE